MSHKKKKIMASQMNGFRAPKKLTKKQQEQKDAVDKQRAKLRSYVKSYTKICEKHRLQVDGKLTRNKHGIMPKSTITPYYDRTKKIKHRKLFLIGHYAKILFVAPFKRKAFILEYEELCKTDRLQLDMVVEITEKGIMPKINIKPYIPKGALPATPEIKDWDEAKKENREFAKQAQADRETLTEEEFKKKWPDRDYWLKKKDEKN